MALLRSRHDRRHHPTYSSWMNLVERFFRDITQDCIREGSFGSIQELVKAIPTISPNETLNPKPTTGKRTESKSWKKSSAPARRWLKIVFSYIANTTLVVAKKPFRFEAFSKAPGLARSERHVKGDTLWSVILCVCRLCACGEAIR